MNDHAHQFALALRFAQAALDIAHENFGSRSICQSVRIDRVAFVLNCRTNTGCAVCRPSSAPAAALAEALAAQCDAWSDAECIIFRSSLWIVCRAILRVCAISLFSRVQIITLNESGSHTDESHVFLHVFPKAMFCTKQGNYRSTGGGP